MFSELIALQEKRNEIEENCGKFYGTDQSHEIAFILGKVEEIEPIGLATKESLIDLSSLDLGYKILPFDKHLQLLDMHNNKYVGKFSNEQEYDNVIISLLSKLDISHELYDIICRTYEEIFNIASLVTLQELNRIPEYKGLPLLDPLPDGYSEYLHRQIKHNIARCSKYLKYPYGIDREKHSIYTQYIKDDHSARKLFSQ